MICSTESINNFSPENTQIYWFKNAQSTLREHLRKRPNENVAKNVIFFLADGMSIPTITAARIYAGQQSGHRGENGQLSFEKFPYVGLTKVYINIDLAHLAQRGKYIKLPGVLNVSLRSIISVFLLKKKLLIKIIYRLIASTNKCLILLVPPLRKFDHAMPTM